MGLKFTDEEITKLKALAAFLSGEAPAAAEPEAPEPEADELDGLDRAGLKKVISDEELEVTVTKAKDDDTLRAEIRNAREAAGGAGVGGEPEGEPEKELAVGTPVKWKVKGKTHSGKVTAIDYDTGKLKAKSDTDKKVYELTPDDLFE